MHMENVVTTYLIVTSAPCCNRIEAEIIHMVLSKRSFFPYFMNLLSFAHHIAKIHLLRINGDLSNQTNLVHQCLLHLQLIDGRILQHAILQQISKCTKCIIYIYFYGAQLETLEMYILMGDRKYKQFDINMLVWNDDGIIQQAFQKFPKYKLQVLYYIITVLYGKKINHTSGN